VDLLDHPDHVEIPALLVRKVQMAWLDHEVTLVCKEFLVFRVSEDLLVQLAFLEQLDSRLLSL